MRKETEVAALYGSLLEKAQIYGFKLSADSQEFRVIAYEHIWTFVCIDEVDAFISGLTYGKETV